LPVFAILQLKDIPDDKDVTLTLPVHSSESRRAETYTKALRNPDIREIKISFKFRPGLSRHHKKLAAKNLSLADVIECLGIVNNNKETTREQSNIKYSSNTKDNTSRYKERI
jgi:hypothetical protein